MTRRHAPRTPAHERVVRTLRLVQYEAATARAKLELADETNRGLHEELEALQESRRISDLRGDVALEAQRALERHAFDLEERNERLRTEFFAPIPMRLHCPSCGELHVDEGVWAAKVHYHHACQFCGEIWRPSVRATVGVRFLPGFKNEETT